MSRQDLATRRAVRYLMKTHNIKYTEALRTLLALGHEEQQKIVDAAWADRALTVVEDE